jgi:hypothetical protein
MTWTDAAIEAMKHGQFDVCKRDKGAWRLLVQRYASLPGDWNMQDADGCMLLVPTPLSGAGDEPYMLGKTTVTVPELPAALPSGVLRAARDDRTVAFHLD